MTVWTGCTRCVFRSFKKVERFADRCITLLDWLPSAERGVLNLCCVGAGQQGGPGLCL